MASKTVEIKNETGLHTRPGNEFVSLAKTFSSQIEVENEAGKRVKGTSLLKLLSLGVKKGTKITVRTPCDPFIIIDSRILISLP